MRRRLLSCGLSPGWQGPSSQHAECAAAAAGAERATWWRWWCAWAPSRGLHQNVGKEGKRAVCVCVCVECVCVCVCGSTQMCFARRGKSQRSGPLSSKTMISIKCRCFVNSSVFTKTPPACFHRQVTVTSCSISLWNLKQRKELKKATLKAWISFVSAAIRRNAYLCQRHEHFFFFSAMLSAELQTLLSVMFFKATREHREKKKAENNQATVIW